MLLMVAEDGFEPPTRVLDDLAMERLDYMRTSLETDATDPPGLALVRAPVGLLSQQRLRLPVRVLPPSPARRPAPRREQRLVPTLPRVTPWGRQLCPTLPCKVRSRRRDDFACRLLFGRRQA